MSSRSKSICINESAQLRIVITGLAVIQLAFGIIVVATVVDGVHFCQRADSGNDLAVGVILVGSNSFSIGIDDLNHITLEVGNVIIYSTVMLQRIRSSGCVIEEVQSVIALGFPQQLAACVQVVMHNLVHGFASAQPIEIIGEINCSGIGFRTGQASAVRPGHGPPGAVVIAGGVANSMIIIRYFFVFCNRKSLRIG